MAGISAAELAKINSFPKLVDLLRNHLEWPIEEDYGFEDVVYEYEASELGLKPNEIAKIREIHQLRPLATSQPWGIFFISFEDKALSVTVLRRILKNLILKKRSGAQASDRQAWEKNDLIFAANFGNSGSRELAFVHFSDGTQSRDLPVMKVLGWNAKDTQLHNDYVGRTLAEKLRWPDDSKDISKWREEWSSAFELRLNEAIRTSRDLALRLAGLATEIRARANELLGAETDRGPMRTMLEAFRKNLIHDLDEDGFADMFAQTIAYGMLAARISRPAGIVADNLADMVPKTNPFLKELFGNFLKIGGRDNRNGLDFDELGVREIVDMLNVADIEAVKRDFGNRNPKKDPIIHFYEDFLHEYDRAQKVEAGIFYTPPAVVGFIVRGVDEMLRTEFGLPLGLADTSTWADASGRNDRITIPIHVKPEAPFVQILDPATGTGTFLVEVIDLIHKRMEEHWKGQGKSADQITAAWNAYVPAHLLPRLTAFEVKMAAYAIAHMKVGLKLTETGYTFGSEERLHVLLTNSLQPPTVLDLEERMRTEAIAHEAERANSAKESTPFTVVIGNPPYSKSITENPFIIGLMQVWKVGLNELKSDLNREEWKFLRLAQSMVNRSGCGVNGFIINRDFLDGITKRILRASLIQSYPRQVHIDLNGDVKGEIADENVFDIQQGVSILVLSTLGEGIRYGSIVGERSEKLEWLDRHSLNATGVDEIVPDDRYHRLLKREHGASEAQLEYDNFAPVVSIFPLYSSGIQTKNDRVTVSDSREAVADTVKFILENDDVECERHFDCGSGDGWSFWSARNDLLVRGFSNDGISKYLYKPFDVRWTYWTGKVNGFHARPRREMAEHMRSTGSLGLQFNRQVVGSFSHAFVTDCLANHGTFYLGNKGQDYIAPIWLRLEANEPRRRPNIDRAWAVSFGNAVGLNYEDGIPRDNERRLGLSVRHPTREQNSPLDTLWDGRGDSYRSFGPRDLFDYIYAVLHSSGYRSRYAEFLKSDFPRIPTPAARTTFVELAALGRALSGLHLLRIEEASVLEVPDIRLAGTGEARVEKGYPEYENGKVMINATRWFEDVPKATWEFHVGGYQVCEKWLKDRAGKGGKNPSLGRVLTEEDILHYRRIVVALTETRRLMAEIDVEIDKHGGWPDAFVTGAGAD